MRERIDLLGTVCPKNTESNNKKALAMLPYFVGVFGVAFLASCLTASIVTPVQNGGATSGLNLNTSAVAYYVNIASNNGSGGTISKDINATYAGTLGVITDTLRITSNTPNGYYVYVSAAEGHNQRLTNTTDSTKYLRPIDTTSYSVSNPGTLSEVNTWGVAVANTYNDAYDAAASYTDATVSQATKFAPLPAYGAEELLITRTGSTYKEAAISDPTQAEVDTIPVYYGFYANSALPSGTYADTVLYTAYAEATDVAGGIATYTDGNVDYVNGGEATFTTSLYTDRDVSTSDVVLTVGGVAATVTSVEKVDEGTNDSVQITATLPAQARPGKYPITIAIAKFGHSSATEVEYGTPGITIAGHDPIKTMQQFSTISNACTDWAATPDRYDSGASAPTYAYGADGSITETMVTNNLSGNWTTTVAGNAKMTNIKGDIASDGLPETYLKDTRDNNYYRIRKLNDGHCWMTENLRLKLTGGTAIDTQNGTWTPHNTTEVATKVGNDWKGTTWGSDNSGDISTQITAQGISSDNEANFRASYYDHSIVNPNTVNTLDGEAQEIGVYYNWNAATAGTGTWANANATDSICPKGWQLPVNSGDKSWYDLLYTRYGNSNLNTGDRRISQVDAANATIKDYHTYAMTNAMRRAPFSLPLTGYFNYGSGTVGNVGSYGYWRTSTVDSNPVARHLGFYSGAFAPQNYSNKGNGFSVRCVSQ